MDTKSLSGRTIVITGASSGAGRAAALAFAPHLPCLVLAARNEKALAETGEECTSLGAEVRTILTDVTDASAVQAAATQLQATSQLDCVVYCAGHYRAMRGFDLQLHDMLRHMEVNYNGALHVLDAVLPGMLARKQGHISLVGSVAGYRGLPNSLAYGPTKAALINLAETLYLDLKDRGIGVSIINPGFVQTPLTAGNDFAMPALLTPQQAATAILMGWSRGAFEVHFPKRFTLWMKALRLLPNRLFFNLVGRATL